MDHRDLEIRLMTAMHRRFDGSTPPPELLSGITAAIGTKPRRVAPYTQRFGAMSFGWAAVAAVVAIVVIALASLPPGGILGPGTATPAPRSEPTAAAPIDRWFVILPPTLTVPPKADTILAGDVLAARIRTLGFGNFSSGAGYGISFKLLAAEGPTSDQVRLVMHATGDVKFVPLPKADYDNAGLAATVGEPLPIDEPALFGWEGIASVSTGPDDEAARPTLHVVLKAATGDAFGSYTTSHVGEMFAVVIDGRVALLAVVVGPILDGEVVLDGGGLSADTFAFARAVLVGGLLPEAWRNPVVPAVRGPDAIVADLIASEPGVTAQSADLDVVRVDNAWRAVWRLVLEGVFRPCTPDATFLPECLEDTTREFVIDAETSQLISSGPVP